MRPSESGVITAPVALVEVRQRLRTMSENATPYVWGREYLLNDRQAWDMDDGAIFEHAVGSAHTTRRVCNTFLSSIPPHASNRCFAICPSGPSN